MSIKSRARCCLQNVTKTRLIGHCCTGYAEIKSNGDNSSAIAEALVVSATTEATIITTTATATVTTLTCMPVCRGGCGQGLCSAPNLCACNIGYEGRHCMQSMFTEFSLTYRWIYFVFLRMPISNVWPKLSQGL